MKNLFEPASADEVKKRIAQLKPDAARVWGTMYPAQMLAHCSLAMEMAVGDQKPPRMFIGRVLGPVLRKVALGNDDPMRRNSPTAKELLVQGDRDLEKERTRLLGLIGQFVSGGPARCTTHPHTFFGPLTPAQWATLMYKHADHHLRQFGV
jgi:Protein of unknown function (DUF1569)